MAGHLNAERPPTISRSVGTRRWPPGRYSENMLVEAVLGCDSQG